MVSSSGVIVDGWLNAARKLPSPNFNERRDGTSIDLIVIHNISLPPGIFGGDYIEAFFTNSLNIDDHPYFEEIAELEVSAHFLIRRNGEIVQFVATDDRAWHAGISNWYGRSDCNDFSIGIELEGTDDKRYEEIQYRQLAGLVAILRKRYLGISANAIVGHSDIAPERKTDPGEAFDWQYFRHLLV